MADKNRSVDDDNAFDDDAFDEDAFDDAGDGDKAGGKAGAESTASVARTRDKEGEKRGFIRNIPYFIREVFAELQKVIWPTRRELLTYATVVVIFVAVMMTIVSLMDVGFAKALLWVFGDSATE